MTKLYEQNPTVSYNQILLPGTHDSATAGLNSSTLSPETGYDVPNVVRKLFRSSLKISAVRNVLFKIAITQHPTNANQFITAQAMAGVRVFDLRVYFSAGEATYQHGTVVWKARVLDTMSHFQQVFRNSIGLDKEVFLFRLSHFKGNFTLADIQSLLSGISSIFGPALKPRGPLNVPISEVMKTPVIIVIDAARFAEPLKTTFSWLHVDSECYNDDWGQAQKVGMSLANLTSYVSSRAGEAPRLNQTGVTELQAHYQFKMPNVLDIIKKKGAGIDLMEVTLRDNVNKTVTDILLSDAALKSKNLSVISYDFYTQDLTDQIVLANTKKLNLDSTASEAVLPEAKVYARMAEATYYQRSTPDIGGYILDASRSNDRVKVYKRPGEVVFAVRGTEITDVKDLVADVGVFFNTLKMDRTYQFVKSQLQNLIASGLKGDKLILTGHSLGGSICTELLMEFPDDVSAVHIYNSGIGYKRFAQNLKDALKCKINSSSRECQIYETMKRKLNVYITGKDPISMLGVSTPGTVHYVPSTSANWHSITNFTGGRMFVRSACGITGPVSRKRKLSSVESGPVKKKCLPRK